MENSKRKPIRSRILKIVLSVAAVSLTVTSFFGILSMISIRKEAENALAEQAKQNLSDVIKSKTDLAEQELQKYSDMALCFAYCIDELLASPDADSGSGDDGHDLGVKLIYADESADRDDLMDEAVLLSDAAPVFRSVGISERNAVKSVYIGLSDGLMLRYGSKSDAPDDDTDIYDYFDASWYKLGMQWQDVCFTDAFMDEDGGGLTVTCAAPLHDNNGSICGVLGMDIVISGIYSQVTDLGLGSGTSAFIADRQGRIISLDPNEINESIESSGRVLDVSDKERMSSFSDGIIVRDNMYYAFDTIRSLGWKLCVRVPASSVLNLANDIGQSIVFTIILFVVFFLAILIFVVIVAIELAEKITRPIIGLTEDVKEISSGDLDYRANIISNDEIGDLAAQFNEMACSLKEQISSLTAVTAEKERMGAELDIAAKIQADTLPVDFPTRTDIRLYATMTPAKEVGGDFYDFFFIDDDHIALVMADVSGKGIPAALFMVIAKSTLHNNVMLGGSTGEILGRVNKILTRGNRTGFFVTVWLGILTISTGELRFSNAGHEYPAIKRANGSFELYRTDNYPPLAVEEELEFGEETVTLGKGDRIFLYTDGVPDARNAEGERFGTDGMIGVLNDIGNYDMISALAGLKEHIDEFIGGMDPFDDITMMGLIWFGAHAPDKNGES